MIVCSFLLVTKTQNLSAALSQKYRSHPDGIDTIMIITLVLMLSIFGSIHPPVFFSLEPGKQPKCSIELSREGHIVLYPASLAWYAKGKPSIFPLRIQQIINK